MKKGSGGRITSLTLEKKGGWEGGRGRGVARRCDGKRCGSGSGGIRRADGGGPANWRAAESRVSQRRAVAAAPLLIAPGAAAGGGWIQRPWRRRWRRQLPSDPRQRILDCSPYAGDMGTRQPIPSLGAPSPVRGTSAAALPPLASGRCRLRKCPRFAPSPEPCQRLRGRLLLASFLPLSLGPGGGGGSGSSSTILHSPGSGAVLCEERRLRSRLALPHSPSPLLLVLRLLPPPPSLTPPSAPPPA
ncbi:uncharacterized protein LOC125174488 [Prionailurus viverrinus]|uniref:uncharacterized protein LOC125174488 n=1 Tax=Prionailurus viverrinus TaxID=61388 RepID=UPI001FF2D8D5|nr:uncharacterized protein LOC125174488 [Prionailurus viverrinus]